MKGKALWVVGGILLVGGVVAYFVFFRKRKAKGEAEGDTPPSTDESAYSQNTTSGGSSGSSDKFTFPFKTTEEGNNFRDFVNNRNEKWAKDNELDRKGELNKYLQKAWDVYGKTYQALKDKKYTLGKKQKLTIQKDTPIYSKADLNSPVLAKATGKLVSNTHSDRVTLGLPNNGFYTLFVPANLNSAKKDVTGFVALNTKGMEIKNV